MTSFIIIAVFSMLTGTMLLMWFGEQITQRGIGNGISLIIFGGIVSGIPRAIGNTISQVNAGSMDFAVVIGIAIVMLLTILTIIYIKTIMQNQNKRIMNYIPVRLNISGVIPPIFASAILMFPLTVLRASSNPIATAITDALTPGGML